MEPMRRKDALLTDLNEIRNILDACDTCRLAMCEGNRPYLVPLNFGYRLDGDNLTIYVHSAKQGKKIDILKKNPSVWFEMDCSHEFILGSDGCTATMHYRCLMGEGIAEELTDLAEKTEALNLLIKHYTAKEFALNDVALEKTAVIRIRVLEYTAKKRGG